MELKEFTFVLHSPDGPEYEMAVPARKESDAERLLKNLLDTLNSPDRIIRLKNPQNTTRFLRFSGSYSRKNQAFNRAEIRFPHQNQDRRNG